MTKVVEPLIAVSIVFVGIENLLRRQPARRWLVTFGPGSWPRIRVDPARAGHRQNGDARRCSTLVIQSGRRARPNLDRRSHFAVSLEITAASCIYAETCPSTFVINHFRWRLLARRSNCDVKQTRNSSTKQIVDVC